jgi:capsule polysaccharide export protein KpsE/RkpR
MGDTGGAVTVGELVDYCQTQARLLHGKADTLEDEAASLLSDIDDELSAVRAQLDEHESATTESSPSPASPDTATAGDDLDDLEAVEDDLAEQQAVVKAKQARQSAFEALATDYLDLADTLAAETSTVSAALERVLEFERDREAYTYFDDRETLLETAAKDSYG